MSVHPLRIEEEEPPGGTAVHTGKPDTSRGFRRTFYPGVTLPVWNDWRWQLRNRLRTRRQIERIVDLTDAERGAFKGSDALIPVAITPYFASLIAGTDPGDPLRRTMVPVVDELERSSQEATDPLAEESDSPVPGLVHRYPDRVLFLVTEGCASYCRYCTRWRRVGDGVSRPPRDRWQGAIDYIADHPEVRDVLISGGDPLTLDDTSIEGILRRVRAIPHVQIIRIGTKTPAVLPMRITPSLVRVLRRYHPLYLSIHATHPRELTPEMVQACGRLADGGIPLGSQTVLLRGINDSVETMRELMHRLLMARVRPYYLYQCDPIPGSSHLRTTVEAGLEIIRGLRGFTSGYAVPTYVIDAPGGGGKIPLLPDYVVGYEGADLVLTNYEGGIYRYPDARRIER